MALSKVAKRRLTRLADFMADLPRSSAKHFNMDQWAKHDGGFKEHGFGHDQELPRTATTLCGTTACALGWACSIPSFYKAGLRLRTSTIGGDHALPTYGSYHTEDAARRFFDITPQQVSDLFHALEIKTPKQWATRARQLIKQWNAA